ncbi:sel1 repeat family protein [Teredinibacter turnerae]|uniref:Sel1 repeat family protein n=1 Tax=Teredinibacter turnerae (strain ATCC 39867 / T7901) TaxID=377629 RepID=C5BRX9_TERTT|nr:sel1 repeat family protein [Teredinibacter turnerae]ACR13996.1 Sel1 repeat family protein [Teredinibacter turnerae T7901]
MRIIVLIIFCLPLYGLTKESCDLDSIGLSDQSSEIEKHFYTGTCHYRNEDYQLSVKSWEMLAKLDPVGDEDEELKVDVLNNLGYMKFFGYGTAEDKSTAIDYWTQAILLGHYEAEYHLCHAYADIEEPTYDKSKARKHCEKAKLIYNGKDSPDTEILDSIEKYLRKLGK